MGLQVPAYAENKVLRMFRQSHQPSSCLCSIRTDRGKAEPQCFLERVGPSAVGLRLFPPLPLSSPLAKTRHCSLQTFCPSPRAPPVPPSLHTSLRHRGTSSCNHNSLELHSIPPPGMPPENQDPSNYWETRSWGGARRRRKEGLHPGTNFRKSEKLRY